MTFQLTLSQVAALDAIVAWIADGSGDVRELSLSGPAGTGKSTLTRFIKERTGTNIAEWTAMTGKAALRMFEAGGATARTLHSALYGRPKEVGQALLFDKVRPWDNGNMVVVIDEASMVTPKIRSDLNEWMLHGARILYIGDGYQLPPILNEAEQEQLGKDFTIFQQVPGPSLVEVMRNGDAILDAATHVRSHGTVSLKTVLGKYEIGKKRIPHVVRDWVVDGDDHVMITWRNVTRMAINTEARRQTGRRGDLPEVGEPILYCRNGQSVLNGQTVRVAEWLDETGEVGSIKYRTLRDSEGNTVRVVCDAHNGANAMSGYMPRLEGALQDVFKHDLRRLGLDLYKQTQQWPDLRLIPITWGYCLTAHKAQGSEFRRVTIYLDNWETRAKAMKELTVLPDGKRVPFISRWVYTCLTRAKQRVEIAMG